MNLAQFRISFNRSVRILKMLDLYKSLGPKQLGQYSAETLLISKKNKHKEIYDAILKNLDYEILLKDDSVFQFSFDPIRYCFVQNPVEFVSKGDYLQELFTPEELRGFSETEIDFLIDTIDENEYEQYINDQEVNTKSNYIRYDVSSLGYAPLLHSYSHIHIGMNDNLRIPSSRIITPFCFVVFSVKSAYYDKFEGLFYGSANFRQTINNCKLSCAIIDKTYWDKSEEFELYLK